MSTAFISQPCHATAVTNYAQCRSAPRSARSTRHPGRMVAFGDASANRLQLASSSTDVGSLSPSFEAIVPDTVVLMGFGATLIVCIVAAWVWSTQVVPVSRTKLALSKRNGPVRDYLDELRVTSATTSSDYSVNSTVSTAQSVEADRALERWLFTDWLNDPVSGQPGRQKEPALPVLKNAKWNSGDNPVLAATALILLGVVVTSVTERIASLSPL